jgi:uncharacterized membrane protein
MLVLATLVLLPQSLILTIGTLIVFGHNLLDPITAQGSSAQDLIWYANPLY